MKPGRGLTEDELDEIMEVEVLETEDSILIVTEDPVDDVVVHKYKRDTG